MNKALLELEKLQHTMYKLAKSLKPEDCTYAEALPYLLKDIYSLRGRLIQVNHNVAQVYNGR